MARAAEAFAKRVAGAILGYLTRIGHCKDGNGDGYETAAVVNRHVVS
jgi:hypothetical protein